MKVWEELKRSDDRYVNIPVHAYSAKIRGGGGGGGAMPPHSKKCGGGVDLY